MANMKLIEAKTVGAGGIASIEFTTIPQTYTDLIIMASGRSDSSTDISIKFNNDSGANYPWQRLLGTGSSIIVGNNTANNLFNNMLAASPAYTANIFGNGRIYITNYTSATGKSVSIDGVTENNSSGSFVALTAGSWTGTAPITSIQIGVDGGGTLLEHSTFYLYGVSNIITSGAKAYGGYVTEDANYFYHTFLSSGTFTPTQSLTADFLVIAGGGGGGGRSTGAGGGAGGLRSSIGITGGGGSLESPLSLTAQAYSITVGSGGAGGVDNTGTTGNNSVFSTITSNGGGAGARGGYGSSETGGSGGSGGGGGASGGTNPKTGGSGTSNQGYAGGNGVNTDTGAAGGGGAGSVGQNGSTSTSPYTGGNGGNGVQINSIATATSTGINGFYASGGGGAISVVGNAGTSQTGGNASNNAYNGSNAFANTGGGGGGGGGLSPIYPANGGAGGSGLVVIRYAK